MTKINNDAFFLCILPDIYNPETYWQWDIKSYAQDFSNQFSIPTDQSYTILLPYKFNHDATGSVATGY